jgi:Fic family protein
MKFHQVQQLKNELLKKKHQISDEAYKSYVDSFNIEYAHNSTAIEGNTLSLIETKTILEDGISVGGKELREIYEVINHSKAFSYVKDCIDKRYPLSESIIKEIHNILMENIIIGGIYRDGGARITGASHKPPEPNEMYYQIKRYYDMLPIKEKELNAIELAAYTHAEFVRIHPFPDGNGRTSRLIMNYQLIQNGYLPISIAKENRLEYYNVLEEYAVNGNLSMFTDMIIKLEYSQIQDFMTLTPKLCNHTNKRSGQKRNEATKENELFSIESCNEAISKCKAEDGNNSSDTETNYNARRKRDR